MFPKALTTLLALKAVSEYGYLTSTNTFCLVTVFFMHKAFHHIWWYTDDLQKS